MNEFMNRNVRARKYMSLVGLKDCVDCDFTFSFKSGTVVCEGESVLLHSRFLFSHGKN